MQFTFTQVSPSLLSQIHEHFHKPLPMQVGEASMSISSPSLITYSPHLLSSPSLLTFSPHLISPSHLTFSPHLHLTSPPPLTSPPHPISPLPSSCTPRPWGPRDSTSGPNSSSLATGPWQSKVQVQVQVRGGQVLENMFFQVKYLFKSNIFDLTDI